MKTQDRIAFCERQLTVADGGPYRCDSPWLVPEFWAPLDGYRVWAAREGVELCPECARLIGTYRESYWDAEIAATRQPHAGACPGLALRLIWLLLLQLKRQQGKTTGVVGFALSTLYKSRRESIAFISGSEDQSEAIFRDNFLRPITVNAALKAHTKGEIYRTRVKVPAAENTLEIFPTSLAGTTGGTRTIVVIDEARAVPWPVAAALLPTVFARNGWRCPNGAKGHTATNGDLEDPNHPTHCKPCGARLEPWTGRVIAMSSAQELAGGERDWFQEAVTAAQERPAAGVHVFASAETLNKKVSANLISSMSDFFGSIEATADGIDIEVGGVSRRKGEAFLTDLQIRQIVDNRLGQAEGGRRPAVAFLDTSISRELTSLVICEAEATPEDPWHTLETVRIDVWDPATLPGNVISEAAIREHLLSVIPLFAVASLRVDTRVMPWAVALVRWLRANAPFRGIVKGVDWNAPEREAAWLKLEERILSGRIKIPNHKRLIAELRGAKRNINATTKRLDVREPNRRQRHLDVAEALASCCLMAHEQGLRQRTSLSQANRSESVARLDRRLAGLGLTSTKTGSGSWY